jgi:hypothetical protein
MFAPASRPFDLEVSKLNQPSTRSWGQSVFAVPEIVEDEIAL